MARRVIHGTQIWCRVVHPGVPPLRWPAYWPLPPPGLTPEARSGNPLPSAASLVSKPTYGRVSRLGIVAFASSLDQAGPMAHSAEDCAFLLNTMAGHDPLDSTSSTAATEDYCATLGDSLEGLRIGLPTEYFGEGLDVATGECINNALKELEAQGATLVEMSLPHSALTIPTYYIIAPAEASTNLARFDGVRYGYRCENPVDLHDLYSRTRQEGFGEEVKRRILVGTYALSAGYYDAYYKKAQQIRRLITQDFMHCFEQVDVIAGPTTPGPAFALGAKSNDPISMYLGGCVYPCGQSGRPAGHVATCRFC